MGDIEPLLSASSVTDVSVWEGVCEQIRLNGNLIRSVYSAGSLPWGRQREQKHGLCLWMHWWRCHCRACNDFLLRLCWTAANPRKCCHILFYQLFVSSQLFFSYWGYVWNMLIQCNAMLLQGVGIKVIRYKYGIIVTFTGTILNELLKSYVYIYKSKVRINIWKWSKLKYSNLN